MQKRRGFTPLEVSRIRKEQKLRAGLPGYGSGLRRDELTGSTRHTNGGFTLIELLVVIAIIALLMAILMPALQRVKKQAKDVICRSNMRQIGVGGNLYAEEYDLFVPRGASGSTQKAWYQLFMPFLSQKPVGNDYRTVKIYRCPRYLDTEQTVCYVVNGWDFKNKNDMEGTEILRPSKLSDCTHRAYTIYLADNEDGPWRYIIRKEGDAGDTRCDVWHPGHLPSSDSQDPSKGRRVARARHRNGCHALFLDWHVEWMAANDMTIDMWRFEK
jgi:prepilin-type N-terminal cleavage/methylation domain-containing protein/prepilin-type processing-associated H-X9-DG protein